MSEREKRARLPRGVRASEDEQQDKLTSYYLHLVTWQPPDAKAWQAPDAHAAHGGQGKASTCKARQPAVGMARQARNAQHGRAGKAGQAPDAPEAPDAPDAPDAQAPDAQAEGGAPDAHADGGATRETTRAVKMWVSTRKLPQTFECFSNPRETMDALSGALKWHNMRTTVPGYRVECTSPNPPTVTLLDPFNGKGTFVKWWLDNFPHPSSVFHTATRGTPAQAPPPCIAPATSPPLATPATTATSTSAAPAPRLQLPAPHPATAPAQPLVLSTTGKEAFCFSLKRSY